MLFHPSASSASWEGPSLPRGLRWKNFFSIFLKAHCPENSLRLEKNRARPGGLEKRQAASKTKKRLFENFRTRCFGWLLCGGATRQIRPPRPARECSNQFPWPGLKSCLVGHPLGSPPRAKIKPGWGPRAERPRGRPGAGAGAPLGALHFCRLLTRGPNLLWAWINPRAGTPCRHHPGWRLLEKPGPGAGGILRSSTFFAQGASGPMHFVGSSLSGQA